MPGKVHHVELLSQFRHQSRLGSCGPEVLGQVQYFHRESRMVERLQMLQLEIDVLELAEFDMPDPGPAVDLIDFLHFERVAIGLLSRIFADLRTDEQKPRRMWYAGLDRAGPHIDAFDAARDRRFYQYEGM